MSARSSARRLRRLPVVSVAGVRVPVARGFRARVLGLAHLDREEAGNGLLIPCCRSVHTFGMRFELDVVFLDRSGRARSVRRGVAPRRLVVDRGAAAVLELPSSGTRVGGAVRALPGAPHGRPAVGKDDGAPARQDV